MNNISDIVYTGLGVQLDLKGLTERCCRDNEVILQ